MVDEIKRLHLFDIFLLLSSFKKRREERDSNGNRDAHSLSSESGRENKETWRKKFRSSERNMRKTGRKKRRGKREKRREATKKKNKLSFWG